MSLLGNFLNSAYELLYLAVKYVNFDYLKIFALGKRKVVMRALKYVVTIISLLVSFSSFAALTATKVENWMAAIPAIEQWSSDNGDILEQFDSKVQGLSDEEAEAMLKKESFYPEFSKMINGYGFDSITELKETSFEIFGAAMSPEMVAQMEEGLAQSAAMLESEYANEAMKKNIEAGQAAITSLLEYAKQTTDADREAIAPYLTEIEQMMNN